MRTPAQNRRDSRHRDTHRDLLIALHADPKIGPGALCRLGAEPELWLEGDASATTLGVPPEVLRRARELAPAAARRAAAERRRAGDAGARLLTRLDPGYPQPLDDLHMPPQVLAVAGELPAAVVAGGPALSLVGSRRADAYGLEVAERFARGVAAAGLPVVSGFARGVDTAGHRGALAAADGRTVAVLGCGVDVAYPRGRRHRELFGRIAGGGGAVVSEFPCGLAPRPWHFPVRNRIIAALSPATLVVRAARRSGSLITARQALELGRDVLAVPGPVLDGLSAGVNRLLVDGAAVAASVRDVLDVVVGPSRTEELERDGGGAEEAPLPAMKGLKGKVLGALEPGRERGAEAVAEELGKGVGKVLGALLELELEGWVRKMPGAAGYARRGLGAADLNRG